MANKQIKKIELPDFGDSISDCLIEAIEKINEIIDIINKKK